MINKTIPDKRSMEERIKHEFWYRGSLRYMLRPDGQTRCYNQYHENNTKDESGLTTLAWNCHRRMGKSFLLTMLCIERCLSMPRQQCKFAAPTRQHVTDIVRPIINQILEDCPKELRPYRREGGTELVFQNPRWEQPEATSVLKLVGVNVGDGDRLRGQAADLVALDECGLYNDLSYIMESVLIYQFAGRELPAVIMATSAPVTIAHDFFETYIPKAIEEESYVEVTADKNKDFTETDKRNVLMGCEGGEGSVSWRREALCEKISDESSLIVPEFQHHIEDVVVPAYERPEFFHPWMCMDTGWKDHTACLYGYPDFQEQVLIVESVIWVHYKTLGDISHLIRGREAEVYPPSLLGGMRTRMRRIGDMTQMDLHNLRKDHGLAIRYVDKGWKTGYSSTMEANIARLRTGIQEGRLKIVDNETTKPLTYQLQHGTWNESRTDFNRPSNSNKAAKSMLGHCDCIAALAYFWRNVNFRENPYPSDMHRRQKFFFYDHHREDKRQGIVQAFGTKKAN